ncbi:MAG: glycosyltransferase [Cyclobacteriaceae bacterium]|nr:glycosyltransferase [Cyclobacteriaceae bacterium]
MSKQKVLLLYPYYWPNYKAGGPIQSLYNIVGLFKADVDFYLFSLDHDIDGSKSEEVLPLEVWCKGPQNENIYFAEELSVFKVFKLIQNLKPDVILINGMFNLKTTIPGLIYSKLFKSKIIISPRGMLQEWALQRNSKKKKIFLTLLKFYLKKNEIWHATDLQEEEDIHKIFGNKQRVFFASNIPRQVGQLKSIDFNSTRDSIKLVFLSLINPNKNLHLIIEAISKSSSRFTLDVYGPIIEKEYWKRCLAMDFNKDQIQYKGPVLPWNVPSVLMNYHFFVLPTQGENFGHAIFDSLSAGVPVVISRKTPWKNIDTANAGFYIEIDDHTSLSNVLTEISQLTPDEYYVYKSGSIEYARNYWKQSSYHQDYRFLLSAATEPV